MVESIISLLRSREKKTCPDYYYIYISFIYNQSIASVF